MNLIQFTDYKYEIIKEIIKSQPIISLLTNLPNTNPDDIDLVDDQIYGYPYVPDIQTEEKTFICLDTNVSKTVNNTVNEFEISIWVFTAYSLQKLPSSFGRRGNRIDNIVTELDKILNGYDGLAIGRFELRPTKTFSPADGYTGKLLQYRCYGFNQNEGQY